MATRQAIRQATIDQLLADATVAALVGTRVVADPHTPYPGESPHPVLFVGIPQTDSAPDSDDERFWGSTETLAITALLARTGAQSDSDLETAADVLEGAVIAALLTSTSWRTTCALDEIRRIRRERVKGGESDRHRMQVTVGIEFVRRETFTCADAALLLETIRVNLNRADDTTGAPVGPIEVTTDIDTRT